MSSAHRRARGIFYTPPALAEAITARAWDLARQSFAASEITALDPACGDGVFLRALASRLPADRIHGVDTDPDALASARAAHPVSGLRLACGDAIVDEPVEGVRPLVWADAFPEVMGQGGFHLVVGNPPFRNLDAPMPGDEPETFARVKRHLQTFRAPEPGRISWADHYRRMCDLYHLFLVRGLWALRPGGVLAFITSRSWIEAWYADRLREHLLEHTVVHIHDLGDAAVFDGTDVASAVVTVRKAPAPADHRVTVVVDGAERTVRQADLSPAPWRLRHRPVLGSVRLGDLCELSQGMQTGANAVLGSLTTETVDAHDLRGPLLRRRVVGSDILPGALGHRKVRWALWTEDTAEAALPEPVRRWLEAHRDVLRRRAAFRRGDCEWYRWTWPRPGQVDRPKILCPYRARENRFWFDASGEVIGLTDTTVLLPREELPVTPEQLCARLNDPEHTRRQLEMGKRTGGGLVEYFAKQLADLPVSL